MAELSERYEIKIRGKDHTIVFSLIRASAA